MQCAVGTKTLKRLYGRCKVFHSTCLLFSGISNCSGEASVCEAVSSTDLTLNCSSCSSAKEVLWKLGTSHLLPYNTSVAQIPAEDVQPGATGCYTCVCGDKSYSFSVDIRAAGTW